MSINNNEDERFTEPLATILRKQCEIVGVDFKTFNFDDNFWFKKAKWNKEQEDEFRKWLIDFLTVNRDARKLFMVWPSKRKRDILKVVEGYVNMYGWDRSDPEKGV